ncbi:uncharacterized protein LOC110728619 [Chenopodium quinoa]|uniref:uncharacterized protein LOC110728619 n=1 Tax=Chenopodium quinoa TaxID=63459 RepID=UPI000B78C760|nr:uncharacterized protein LOC110728619 [Chenopodium quinoa]
MEKWSGVLCPRIQEKLDKEKHKATYCDVHPSTDQLFNVIHGLNLLVVNLEEKTCSCRKWEMVGISCCHVVACIFFMNKEAEDYVERCYTREAYLQAYAGSIPPFEGERFWPKVQCPLDPPPIKIGPGRPRKNIIRDPFENPKKPGCLTKSGVKMTCSLCKYKGHNKRRCPNKDTIPPPTKRHRGRPRNDGQPPHSNVPENPQTQVIISASAPHHSFTA